MKISNLVLASMVSATVLVSCKTNPDDKKQIVEKQKKLNQQKNDSLLNDANNCPACGMG